MTTFKTTWMLLLCCALLRCGGDEDPDASSDVAGEPEADMPGEVARDILPDIGSDPTPGRIQEACSEYLGLELPASPTRYPAEDGFCTGQPDCAVSSGAPGHTGCPSVCSCLCYQDQTYLLACTPIPCDEPAQCT